MPRLTLSNLIAREVETSVRAKIIRQKLTRCLPLHLHTRQPCLSRSKPAVQESRQIRMGLHTPTAGGGIAARLEEKLSL